MFVFLFLDVIYIYIYIYISKWSYVQENEVTYKTMKLRTRQWSYVQENEVSTWQWSYVQENEVTVRKRIKKFFSGSLEKQSLTLFPVYYDNFSNLDS
jgi:hypothetical protein